MLGGVSGWQALQGYSQNISIKLGHRSLEQVTAGQQTEALAQGRASAGATEQEQTTLWLNVLCGPELIQTVIEESEYWASPNMFQINNAPESKRDDSKPQIRPEAGSRNQGSGTSPWLLAFADKHAEYLQHLTDKRGAMCILSTVTSVRICSFWGHGAMQLLEQHLS